MEATETERREPRKRLPSAAAVWIRAAKAVPLSGVKPDGAANDLHARRLGRQWNCGEQESDGGREVYGSHRRVSFCSVPVLSSIVPLGRGCCGGAR